MKRVSFKVAKVLKEAGYPQGNTLGQYAIKRYYDPNQERELLEGQYSEMFMLFGVDAPTYMEVWLWLWREKKTIISCQSWHNGLNMWGSIIETSSCYDEMYEYDDPEDALIAAIEHLVDNNLIH